MYTGRLLQHMDQTISFRSENIQLLVLDEADRILDMGFRKTVDGIIQHLPKERQTRLFSATQTSSVRDLARLSLKSPEYIAVHEGADKSTPEGLQGYYIECPLPEKLDTLYGFIKTHLKTKALVFMSSCKQVTFNLKSFLVDSRSALHMKHSDIYIPEYRYYISMENKNNLYEQQ